MSARTTATTATGERPAVPVPRDGWVQVANAFIDARPLDNERLAHILLMSYAWDDASCHPSQEELSGRLGVSVRTIKRRTRALRGGGTVTVTRGGKAHPNVYQLHVRPVRDEDGVQFTTLVHGVLDDPALSEGAKRAYVVLCRGAGGSGWWVISNAAIGARLGVTVRAVYTYVRELESAGHVRIVPHTGRVNTYHVGTPEQRKRSAVHGATAPLLVITQPRPADDGRWRALYEELMRVTPARQVVRGVRTLLAAVGETTVLEAIRGGAEWCARAHQRTLTIRIIRVEVAKLRDAEGLPALSARPVDAVEAVEIALPPADMEPAWRDALNDLRGEMTPENYKRWLEPTTVLGREGDLLRVGVSDAFDARWLDRRLRAMIERALGRVAPGVRVAFEVREAPLAPVATDATDADEARPPAPLAAPPRASPRASPAPTTRVTIERCAQCHAVPCRCPRKERRARERAAERAERGTP